MGNLRYAHYDDDITTALAWSVETGTEVTQYEAANIGTDVMAKPAKLAETSGAWLADATGRPGGKQRVDAVVLPMHNLDAGLEVRLQGNATDSWGGPTFNQAITIPAYRGDLFPVGPFLDITGLSGYTSAGFEYWRLVVVGTNSAPVAVKCKLLAQLRTLDPNINWELTDDDEHPIIEHETEYGVSSIYDLAVHRRELSGSLDSPDVQRAAYVAWRQSTRGKAYPFVMIPDGGVNDAWFVRFDDTRRPIQPNFVDRNNIRLGFKEVSRGLRL